MVIEPLSSDGRRVDIRPMRKIHVGLFPHILSPQTPAAPPQYCSEDEDNNVDIMQQAHHFLQHSGYSEDERSEFYFLLEQGFNLEEARDFISQRRANIQQQTIANANANAASSNAAPPPPLPTATAAAHPIHSLRSKSTDSPATFRSLRAKSTDSSPFPSLSLRVGSCDSPTSRVRIDTFVALFC